MYSVFAVCCLLLFDASRLLVVVRCCSLLSAV